MDRKAPISGETKPVLPRRTWMGAFVVAALLAAAVASSGPARDWFGRTWRFQQIRAQLQARDYNSAARDLSTWIESHPKDAEAHYLLGMAQLGANHPQEAIHAFDRARRLGYPEAPLERAIGILFARAGRHREAEPMLLRDLSRSPAPDAERDEALAKVYLETLRLNLALQAIDRWAAAAPHQGKPHLWRAEVNARLGASPARLAEDYQRALAIEPTLDDARLPLAEALAGAGRHAEALEHFRQYLNQHPNDANALARAAASALAEGEENEALGWVDRALSIDPNNVVALDARSSLAIRQRDNQSALRWLDAAIAADPHNPEFHYRRALALERLGRADEARDARERHRRLQQEALELEALRKAIVAAPRDARTTLTLARWLIEHNRADEGEELAQRAFELPDGRRDAARLLADYYARTGNAARANYFRIEADRSE